MKNSDFLQMFVKDVFGYLVLSPEKWPIGVDAEFNIGRTYFYDRSKYIVPFHEEAINKLLLLYRYALAEESTCDGIQVSRNLCECLESILTGTDFRNLKFQHTDTKLARQKKKDALLAILRFIGGQIAGKKTVVLVELQAAYKKEARGRNHTGAWPLMEEIEKTGESRKNASSEKGKLLAMDAVKKTEANEKDGRRRSAARLLHTTPAVKESAEDVSLAKREGIFVQKRFPMSGGNCFVGRRTELARLQETLEKTRNCVISGMGGIGKSALARNYAETYQGTYRQILWLAFEKSLATTLADDDKLQIRGMERLDFCFEDDEAYARRKLRMLLEGTDRDTLVILDNYDVENDPLEDIFLQGMFTLLVTTRITGNFGGRIQEVCVGELADGEVYEVFAKTFHTSGGLYLKMDLTNKILQEILFHQLGRHTYAVVWSASLLANERVDGERMDLCQLLNILRDTKLFSASGRNGELPFPDFEEDVALTNSGMEGKVQSQAARKQRNELSPSTNKAAGISFGEAGSIYTKLLRQLEKLFRLETLREDELYFLKNLALVSSGEISIWELCHLCKFTERMGYAETIHGLIRQNWILYDGEKDHVSLHVLLRRVLLANVKNDESTFDAFAETLWKHLSKDCGGDSETENEKYYQLVVCASEVLPQNHRQHYFLEKLKQFCDLKIFEGQEKHNP